MHVRGDSERFYDATTIIECSDQIGIKGSYKWRYGSNTNPASKGACRHRNTQFQTKEYGNGDTFE